MDLGEQLAVGKIHFGRLIFLSGSGADLSNTSVPFILPGEPGNSVLGLSVWCLSSFLSESAYFVDYPEW